MTYQLSKAQVVSSSSGEGGRVLGGRTKICTLRGRGMKNKEHFKRMTMKFLRKSWSGDQNIYTNLRGGTKAPPNI